MSRTRSDVLQLPVLPLRDVVVFPHMVISLFVGRDKSMRALEQAMEGDKQVLLLAQKSAETDDPDGGDLYTVGTLAQVLQLLKLPDGTIKVLVEGSARVHVDGIVERDGALHGRGELIEAGSARSDREVEAVARTLTSQFEQYVKTNRKLPPELLQTLSGIDDPARLADTIAAHIGVRLSDKQRLLESADVGERLELLVGLVEGEIDVQQMEKRIRGRVKSQMEKSQREYYLNEQMKAIQKELGDLDESPGEMDELVRRVAEAGMPKAVEAKARAELNKLKQMSPMSAEAAVVRNYLDWLLGVPWKKRSKVRKDLKVAQLLLDRLHLLVEVVLALALLHLALDPAADAFFHLLHVDLAIDQAHQQFQPAGGIQRLQQLLLVGQAHAQVRGDGVGQAVGLFDTGQGLQQLRRQLAVGLDVLLEQRQQGAHDRLHFARLALLARGHFMRGGEQCAVLRMHFVGARPRQPFHQHLDGAVRQLQQLQHLRHGADGMQVAGFGIVGIGGFLRHKQDALVALHGDVQRADRLLPPHEQRDHHVREHHHVAQRQHRQYGGFGSGLGGHVGDSIATAARRRRHVSFMGMLHPGCKRPSPWPHNPFQIRMLHLPVGYRRADPSPPETRKPPEGGFPRTRGGGAQSADAALAGAGTVW